MPETTQIPKGALRQLQTYLSSLGYPLGTAGPLSDGVDGEWGPLTEAALQGFLSRAPRGAGVPGSLSGPSLASPPPPGLVVPGLAPQYAWLLDLGDKLPLTIWCALKELGVKELSGGANSPVIMGWAEEVGLKAVYTADAIPWCGLFAAVIVKRAEKPVVKDPLWALNWSKFGEGVGQPGLGDILTFTRDGGGHVAFYIGEDRSHYHVLGGNQSDQVSIMRLEKKRLHSARRPLYRTQPASVKPYAIAASGVVSTNEA